MISFCERFYILLCEVREELDKRIDSLTYNLVSPFLFNFCYYFHINLVDIPL